MFFISFTLIHKFELVLKFAFYFYNITYVTCNGVKSPSQWSEIKHCDVINLVAKLCATSSLRTEGINSVIFFIAMNEETANTSPA